MTDCINKFTVHTREEQASLLAQKLPNGSAWRAKYLEDTNFRNLLIAVGLELSRIEQAENELYCETQLETTNKLIENFELEFGIIGGCLDGYGTTIQERIDAIKLKISINGTSTKEQFESIATTLGLDITVIPGYDTAHFTFTLPMLFWNNLKNARFTMIIDMQNVFVSRFTHEFTFIFGDAAVAVMKCLFNKLKPGNVQLLYINET